MAWRDWTKRLILDERTWGAACFGHAFTPLDAGLYPVILHWGPSPVADAPAGPNQLDSAGRQAPPVKDDFRFEVVDQP